MGMASARVKTFCFVPSGVGGGGLECGNEDERVINSKGNLSNSAEGESVQYSLGEYVELFCFALLRLG